MKMVNIPRIKALQHPEALKWAEMGESLNEAVEYKHTRPFKTLNLHLWSREPGMCKSTFV